MEAEKEVLEIEEQVIEVEYDKKLVKKEEKDLKKNKEDVQDEFNSDDIDGLLGEGAEINDDSEID